MKRNYRTLPRRTEQGFMTLTMVITTLVIMFIVAATIQLVVQNNVVSVNGRYELQSQLAAESGADYAVQQITADGNWSGSSGQVELSNDSSGRTTYETTVTTSPDGLKKTLAVTGRVFIPASSTDAKATSKIEVGLKGNGASGVDGKISAYVGVGGLIMSGTSAVTDGMVFSNGELNMSGSALIGSGAHTVDVYVANKTCPVGGGSSFPRLCNNGENNNPISLPSGTHIYGQVKANNQTNGSGMASPGLVAGSVTPSDLPSDDRASKTTAINSSGLTQTGASAGCSGNTSKTWPANLKITGDVTIANGCAVTAAGNVWITGNLTVSGSGKLIVQNGLTVPPHILVDGSTGFKLLLSGSLVPNANDTGFRVVTYYSASPCSVSDSGCNVTGTDLYNSLSMTTIDIEGSTQALKTQFYARWTKAALIGSSDIGSLVGQTVSLAGSSEIHSGVSVDPSEAGTLTWSVETYRRLY